MFGWGEELKKQAGTGSEKESLYEILKKTINILSVYKVLWANLVFLAVGMVLDIFHCIKLCYDEGNLIAIIVLVWTFTVSFSVYCIEHFGESYYGIRRSDILLADLGLKGVSALAGLVFMEISALIGATVFKWYLTIVVIAIEQIFVTIYIPLIVVIKTSYTNTLEQIEKEAKDAISFDLRGLYRKIKGDRQSNSLLHNNSLRLFQMIRELDYTNDRSRGRLLEMLKKISELLKAELNHCFESGTEESRFEIQKAVNTVSCQITLEVLKSVQDSEIRIDFFSQLMSYSTSLEFSQGVMMALLENPTLENMSICQQLLCIEEKYQRQLQIWCAVYNVYMQTFAGEEWRSLVYTEQMFRELYTDWGKSDMKTAIEAWEQMQDSQMNYGPLFQYIFLDGKKLL